MTGMIVKLKGVDGWIRNRLRYCIWHHWKKPERKRKNLIRLGVEQGQAYAWSRSGMGGWSIAQSPILGTTITLDRLKKRGYESMLYIYKKTSPQLNEPLYTRPAGRRCERFSARLWPSGCLLDYALGFIFLRFSFNLNTPINIDRIIGV